MSVVGRLRRVRPRPETAAVFVALCVAEAAALAAYLTATPNSVTAPRYVLYPFVWVNAAVLAVWRTTPAAGVGRRRRVLAAGVGGAYFLVLAWTSGLLGAAGADAGLTVYWGLPPGWGPLVVWTAGPLRVAPTPYVTAGYLALAYLAYAAVLDADASLTGLAAGALSCVSCTLPVLAALASAVTGGVAAVGAAAAAASYDLSTAVYLVAVALLVWRPDAPSPWPRSGSA